MLEAVQQALGAFFQPHVFGLILIAVPIGLVFGILPGLGGLTALAILLPFVYGMDPVSGLAFLLALHSVVYTGGSVTAVLIGVPGSPPNAATVLDGYPLSRKGQAGYAIGAALTASALGGVLGVVLLALILPFLKPVVMAFSSPETLILTVLGLCFIGVLGENQPLKGLAAGALGIFLAMFGEHRVSGVARFWFDYDYLLDGFRLIPIALGLFAIPEIVAMLSTGSAVSQEATKVSYRQVWEGCTSVFKHFWLFIQSSVIGVIVGIIPGVGGETSPFVAYAFARQSSKHPEAFGKGIIEGVIAPESSNNAKEGGALVPTLAFGIPGSAGMALLLGGFLILGLQPGPEFLKNHMDIALGLAAVVAVANVLATLMMLALAKQFGAITSIKGSLLGPILLVLVVLGALSTSNDVRDVFFTFVFGFLGYFMVLLGYSRAALLLGFVLGNAAETYLHISLNAFGPLFWTRPISLLLIAILIFSLTFPLWRNFRRRAGDDND
ncbi:tripartite tricarboxylate transporter permease [Propylenella binzhouense]|uniref:DUF112 domain-containing protein n=1 Tax=Propylenella binzhouense TaxID=2555902 RepID=A0A964T850_9HYPH|nr:tripartite tricarboxylate transporter permease [Propylenella binzhouense]MYZ50311.1 hypothetical protein [Propylenella binzhouense]